MKKELSRREFLKINSLPIYAIAKIIVDNITHFVVVSLYLIFAYILFIIASTSWTHFFYLLGAIGVLYLLVRLVRFLDSFIKQRIGPVGRANFIALDAVFSVFVCGFLFAMAMRASYENRVDNFVMWITFIIMHVCVVFKETRKRELLNAGIELPDSDTEN